MKPALCGFLFLALCGCAGHAVRPSPTADQVMAEQYRARGAQGAIGGPEASAIAEAYRRDIGGARKPSESEAVTESVDRNP
jgi:hypothetical protein